MFAQLLNDIGITGIALAVAIMTFAGFVKGVVGFALPMVAVSGLGSALPPTYAVAGVLIPALLTNIWQALRDGVRPAWSTLMDWWGYTLLILTIIACVAPFVAIISTAALFLILGSGITSFSILQLMGWRPSEALVAHPAAKIISGTLAGIFGGLAAVTGPPIVLYLLARNTPKAEQVRLQGIIFAIGLCVSIAVHNTTGVLNTATWPLSLALIIPAFVGMALGLSVQDRLPQAAFRRATLLVLVIAGLNLLRRGIVAL